MAPAKFDDYGVRLTLKPEKCSDNDISGDSPTSNRSVGSNASEETPVDEIKPSNEVMDTENSPELPEALTKSERDSILTDAQLDQVETPSVSNNSAIAQLEDFLTFSRNDLEDLTRKDNDARETHNANQREKYRNAQRSKEA